MAITEDIAARGMNDARFRALAHNIALMMKEFGFTKADFDEAAVFAQELVRRDALLNPRRELDSSPRPGYYDFDLESLRGPLIGGKP